MSTRSTLVAWVCGATLLAGCDSNKENGGKDNTPRTATPAELQGDWKRGTISFTNFWDDQGEYIGNAGGSAVYFQFEKDGHYKQFVYLSQRTYGCHSQTWTETNGTATFEADKFTVYPTVGHYKAADTCNTANNFERPMTEQERKDNVRTFLWKFEQDGDKKWLVIGFSPDTWNSYFERP